MEHRFVEERQRRDAGASASGHGVREPCRRANDGVEVWLPRGEIEVAAVDVLEDEWGSRPRDSP